MTLDFLIAMFRCHLAALQSSAWPSNDPTSKGPALYFDEADTLAAIAELSRLRAELLAARSVLRESHPKDQRKCVGE